MYKNNLNLKQKNIIIIKILFCDENLNKIFNFNFNQYSFNLILKKN